MRIAHENYSQKMFNYQKMTNKLSLLLFLLFFANVMKAQTNYLLIPMDEGQSNHLKAYGLVFNHLTENGTAQWLLNYQAGSFLLKSTDEFRRKALSKNVDFELLSSTQAAELIRQVEDELGNTAVVNLEKAPKIAVYTPKQKLPWNDAVTLALTYAEVEYDKIWDIEVLNGKLSEYDWLHLHHEDFTGQYGKFWRNYQYQPWYVQQLKKMEIMARELGYDKVSEEKKAVARTIKEYVLNGGFLFAMCSGTDTFDIALAAEGLDIAPTPFDGDPADSDVNSQLDFSKTLAFQNFSLVMDPAEYEHADIDVPVDLRNVDQSIDYFTLFDFSAKWDPVPSMLTQNHVSSVRGFYGQTTAYRKDKIKSYVTVLGENSSRAQVKYLHGNYGKGTFTFYAGHDPEDYTHRVDDPPTDLALHPNSPGYRLILNNILFPAAKKKKRKT